MKKLYLTIAALLIAGILYAQEETAPADTFWTINGSISVNFSQVSLSNWAAGGENSISSNGLFEFSADYDNGEKLNWDNDLKIGYGLIIQGDDPARKSDDHIDLSSKLGYKISEHWLYSNLIGFNTQMAPGYDLPGDVNRTKISNFMAPGYLNLSTGFDWKPFDGFSLFFSPITGKFTFLLDEDLDGEFGVEPGKQMRSELGGYFKMSFNRELVTNVKLNTTLDLFSNYIEDPQNIDVKWDLLLTFTINKYLSASLITNLIYDHDIKFDELDDLGNVISSGPRTQFKEVFGLGLTYSF